MVRKEFVPFFEKHNDERLSKKARTVSFPNYMNWYVPEELTTREHHAKKTSHFQSGSADNRETSRDLEPMNWSRSQTSTNGRAIVTDEVQRDDKEMMQRRKLRHQAIRQDLAEYQTYQMRQPFKRTPTPSIWQEPKGSQSSHRCNESMASKSRDSLPEQSKQVQSSTPKPPKNKIKPKNHLNKGLETIMSQEQTHKGNSRFFS